jgi:hypothetical protein
MKVSIYHTLALRSVVTDRDDPWPTSLIGCVGPENRRFEQADISKKEQSELLVREGL